MSGPIFANINAHRKPILTLCNVLETTKQKNIEDHKVIKGEISFTVKFVFNAVEKMTGKKKISFYNKEIDTLIDKPTKIIFKRLVIDSALKGCKKY